MLSIKYILCLSRVSNLAIIPAKYVLGHDKVAFDTLLASSL